MRPPYSATGRGDTPAPVWEKAFMVVRFHRAWPFLQTIAISHARFPHPTIARVAADSAAGRRAGEARPKGKAGSERRKACFHPGGSGFHLPRNVRSAFQFYSSSFYGHKAGSLFLSLYAPRFCLAASAGFGRQFTKLRALSRLRRRYDSRKKRTSSSPVLTARKPSAAPRAARPR